MRGREDAGTQGLWLLLSDKIIPQLCNAQNLYVEFLPCSFTPSLPHSFPRLPIPPGNLTFGVLQKQSQT